jgi:hypothetical protein
MDIDYFLRPYPWIFQGDEGTQVVDWDLKMAAWWTVPLFCAEEGETTLWTEGYFPTMAWWTVPLSCAEEGETTL